MGNIAGRRGRYQAYPQSPGAGGGASSGNPLSRQRFIDGGTASPGPGAASNPFKTIADFIASRGDASVADATANYVGWIMPTLSGYTEDISLPAYVSTELRGASISAAPGSGTVITGSVTWNNVAPADHAASLAIVSVHNLTVTGAFTVTDDAGAPTSEVIFGGDEIFGGVGLNGGFSSPTTSKLSAVAFLNAIVLGGVDTGVSASSAAVSVRDSFIGGDISVRSLGAINSQIASSAVSVSPTGIASFQGCVFGVPTVLTAINASGGARFDGLSWTNFLGAGGTRAAGTTVLVSGGYNGASVEGATLPTTGTNTDVSLNGAGATAGYTGENSGNHYSSSGLAADGASVTLKTGGGELVGDTISIAKVDAAAHDLAVKNNAGATIATIQSTGRGFVTARFDGSDWVFVAGGALP